MDSTNEPTNFEIEVFSNAVTQYLMSTKDDDVPISEARNTATKVGLTAVLPVYRERMLKARNEIKDGDVVDEIEAKTYTELTMELHDKDGVCLMSCPLESPVVTGDMVQFPPIRVTI